MPQTLTLIFTALENIQRVCSTIQGAEFTYNVYLKTSQGKLKCLVWVNFGLHLLCVLKRELANSLVGGKESLSVSTVGDFSTSLYTIYKETSESSTEGPRRVWTRGFYQTPTSHWLICTFITSQHPLVHQQRKGLQQADMEPSIPSESWAMWNLDQEKHSCDRYTNLEVYKE